MERLENRVLERERVSATARSFLRACTSTPATARNVAIVGELVPLLSSALDSNDFTVPRALLKAARKRGVNVQDLVGAATQCVMEEFGLGPSSHTVFKRLVAVGREVAPIEPLARRDALRESQKS